MAMMGVKMRICDLVGAKGEQGERIFRDGNFPTAESGWESWSDCVAVRYFDESVDDPDF
jgi:hypothetical protein